MSTRRFAALPILSLLFSLPSFAAARDDIIQQYATQAQAASPDFNGFSASRGEKLYSARFAGGKAETPSCASCHGDDPRSAGRSPTGKTIAPVALSASPTRYVDVKKVEKWFRRNCNDVLGRECSPQEKGDWLTYVISR